MHTCVEEEISVLVFKKSSCNILTLLNNLCINFHSVIAVLKLFNPSNSRFLVFYAIYNDAKLCLFFPQY